MASPEQITEVLPETLPGDFVEWDESPASQQLVRSGNGGPGTGVEVVSTPSTQPEVVRFGGVPLGNPSHETRLSISAPENTAVAAVPHRSRSLSQALLSSPDFVVPLEAALPTIDKFRFSAPHPGSPPAAPEITRFHEIQFHALRAKAVEIARTARKKWAILAPVSAAVAVIFAAAMIPVFNRGPAPSVNPAAAPAPTVLPMQQPKQAAPMRAHSTVTVPTSAAAAATASQAQIISEAARQPAEKNAAPSTEQAPPMDAQLQTPARLELKAPLAERPPPPSGAFNAADIDGSDNGNAIRAAFASPKPPAVQIAPQQAVTVPPGVALGLLIKETKPVYPLIAKTAKVSGIIVLAVSISKTGNIENLRVLSGPAMLRTTAVDAVRTWRFRPYMLNGQATAIESTINVQFSFR